ncbi:MAG: hypothetical protein NZU63_09295 [Gemmataceae bacterium]|nr:hypothetical protein [Gemmataceae bacterium]
MFLEAFIFVPALVGSIIAGLVFVSYAAHHYLTILEGSASGQQEVAWLPETLIEFFWKAGYLAWLLGMCYAPAYLLACLLVPMQQGRWIVIILVVALLFPIVQLSSMAASSPWFPFSAGIINRLIRHPHLLLTFYACSLPLVAVIAAAVYGLIGNKVAFPVAVFSSFACVLSLFLYARLMGRLACALRVAEPLIKPRRRRKRRKPIIDLPAAASAALHLAPPPPRIADLPPIHTPLDGPVHGYELQQESQPKPSQELLWAELIEPEQKHKSPDPADRTSSSSQNRASSLRDTDLITLTETVMTSEGWRTYACPSAQGKDGPVPSIVADQSDRTTPYPLDSSEVPAVQATPLQLLCATENERRLLKRERQPEGLSVFVESLFTFLAQPQTLKAWLTSSLWGVVVAIMVHLARTFYPSSGG